MKSRERNYHVEMFPKARETRDWKNRRKRRTEKEEKNWRKSTDEVLMKMNGSA